MLTDRTPEKEPPTANRGKTPPTHPLTIRERRVMLIVVAVAALVIALGATIWTSTSRSSDGCVNVPLASTMGGAVERACGAAAQDWCRAASIQHDAHAQAVQAQCRIAGVLR
ncbi:MAG TPA: hypothetical protein VMU34_14465 [Mycobacterium sp.]|nr:hypothetical protein [Mycobacterium sp.]